MANITSIQVNYDDGTNVVVQNVPAPTETVDVSAGESVDVVDVDAAPAAEDGAPEAPTA